MTRFRTLDGAALVITTVVGAGIFTAPAYVAALAGAPALIISLWIAGGLMAFAGALSYAELAARVPRGGAEYVYLREAFGPLAGFLSGWTSFVAGFSGAIAAAAVGCAAYVIAVFPGAAVLSEKLIALAMIAVFTLVSLAGIRASRAATNGLALLIVVGIVVLSIAGLVGRPIHSLTAAPYSIAGALSALTPIVFTYSGWNAAAYVAGEFEDPQRNVPRALLVGTLVVTVLYVALNSAMLTSLSPAGLAAARAPVTEVAQVVFPTIGPAWVAVLALTALASSVCAMIVTGPRIYLEMARDRALPRFFGRTRKGIPVTAIVAQSAWSGVLVLTGTFAQIVSYTGFSIVLFSGAAVCALFVLRHRRGPPSTYRVPGYPAVPIAFIACSVAIVIASIRYAPLASLAGVVLIASGGVFHVLASRASR